MSPDKQTLDELRIDRAAETRGRSRIGLIVVAIVVLLFAAAAVWWFNRPKAPVVRTVVVQQPGSGGAGDRTLLNGTGYVTARRQSTVSSKVTGKVVEVMVEEGMKVEAGQILARIDSSNIEKSLHLAEAQLESSRKALDETRVNLGKAEREGEVVLLLPLAVPQLAGAEQGEQRRVPGQHAEVAVGAGNLDLVDPLVDERPIGRDDLQLDVRR